jgi:hypothetical protein
MAEVKEDPEITLETYDKHHVKVAKSIATRSAIINMMIDGMHCFIHIFYVIRTNSEMQMRVMLLRWSRSLTKAAH